MSFEVYLVTSPSGRRYVGLTSIGAAERWRAHVRDARHGATKSILHSAIRKYGARAFSHTLLERMSTEAGAKRAEILWIRELGTQAPGGYNVTAGGEGILGYRFTAESKARRSAARKGVPRPELVGRKASVETRAKMRAAKLGVPRAPGIAEKTATSQRGRKHTEKARAKMRAGQQARWARARSRS